MPRAALTTPLHPVPSALPRSRADVNEGCDAARTRVGAGSRPAYCGRSVAGPLYPRQRSRCGRTSGPSRNPAVVADIGMAGFKPGADSRHLSAPVGSPLFDRRDSVGERIREPCGVSPCIRGARNATALAARQFVRMASRHSRSRRCRCVTLAAAVGCTRDPGGIELSRSALTCKEATI
jgi:hypothetical protein